MNKIVLLLLLFPFIGNAQLNLNPIPPYAICESNTDGFALFDLNSHVAEILDSENYDWEFYQNQAAINSGITLPLLYTNIIPHQETIYIVVTETTSGISQTLPINLIIANAPNSFTFSPLTVCDESLPNDGITTFDLTSKNNEINAFCPDCIVSFYTTNSDVEINNPENFSNTSNPQLLHVLLTSPGPAGCSSWSTLTLKVVSLPAPNPNPNDLITCNISAPSGIEQFNLTIAEEDIRGNDNQSVITFYTNLTDAEAGINAITDPTNYSSGTATIWVKMESNTNNPSDPKCYKIVDLKLIVNPKPHILITTIGVLDTDGIADNNTIVDLDSYIPALLGEDSYLNYIVSFHSSESDAQLGISQIASPYTTGTTTIYYSIMNLTTACLKIGTLDIVIFPEDYETLAPTGATTQTFTEGETLADIEIDGENIQWYDNPGETTGLPFTPKNNDTPLPLTTLLVNNTTYYASQKVYNIESTERLAVTVSTTMGMEEKTFTSLKYYPNPVTDVLTLTNSNIIEALTVINMLGQTIITKQINTTNTQLDLSSLNNGVYFVKISAEGKNKTLKIIKE